MSITDQYAIDIGGSSPIDVDPIGWSSVRRGDFATRGQVTWAITSALELCDFVQITYEVVRSPAPTGWRGRLGYLQHSEYGSSGMSYWRMTNVTRTDCATMPERR